MKNMLSGIHFLLSYMCNLECDHCFVYSNPHAEGTFTLKQIRNILDDAKMMDSVEWVYFEGGEPFLFYPILLEAVKYARTNGFKVGIVTNGYFATSREDLEYWLKPLAEMGISDLTISDDSFHYGDSEESDNPAKRVLAYAENLNIPVNSICVEKPMAGEISDEVGSKGSPVIGGGVMFRGRAVEKLLAGLPKHHWETFTECPHEDLSEPKRVHIDSYGNVHICQGLCMGNVFETPLSLLVEKYDGNAHPICKPLIEGGPASLVKTYNLQHENEYVDACHICYLARSSLVDRFPQYLLPRQIYGLE